MAAVAFVDVKSHPSAVAYYRTFTREPTVPAGHLEVFRVIPLPGKRVWNLISLLDSMLTSVPPGGDVILVSHGNADGIMIQFGPTTDPTTFDTVTVNRLLDPKAPFPSSETWRWSPAIFASLRAKVAKIRDRGIGHLAIRACQVGKGPATLAAYKKLFRAGAVSAPVLNSLFGMMRPGVPVRDEPFWSKWLSDRITAEVFAKPPHRFAYRIYDVDETSGFKNDSLAEPLEAIQNFIRAHLMEEFIGSPSSFPIGGMIDWPNPIVFPTYPAYREKLVLV